ncbi:hypothetical protein D9M68_636330 [compost metagenome]
MKARPTRVRNRLAAPSTMSTITGTITQYRRNDVSSGRPKSCAGGSEMPVVPPVSLRLANRKCVMNDAAMVAMARYRPFTRSDGMPTTSPPSIATTPPARMFSRKGVPSRVCMIATVYAPRPMNAACPRLTRPV